MQDKTERGATQLIHQCVARIVWLTRRVHMHNLYPLAF
jgi:hypothetical protein